MASLGSVATALAVGVGNAAITPFRPDPGPATRRWGVGVGEVAASVPKLPGPIRHLVRQLNQFGSVVVSPGGIEYDGDEVAWDRVTEIKNRRLVGYLLTDAVTKQVDRLPIWWFPGRDRVLRGLTHTALTAMAMAANPRLDRGVYTVCIPAEVVSKGVIRSHRMTPGVPAALVLADPAVSDYVTETAAAKGIPIHYADDDALEVAVQRAAAIRSAIRRLLSP